MLWRTEASLKQVRSAMSSYLSYLGWFIFCMYSILLLVSSPWAFFMKAATKPWVSWGTQTSLFQRPVCLGGGVREGIPVNNQELEVGICPVHVAHDDESLPVTCRYQMSSKTRVLNSHCWVWKTKRLDRHSFTGIAFTIWIRTIWWFWEMLDNANYVNHQTLSLYYPENGNWENKTQYFRLRLIDKVFPEF